MLPYILIIEDEKSIADTIVYSLKNDGFLPIWCSTGQKGLKAIQEHDFSVVVLDVGLPDISGLEICKKIRSVSRVPIIFLSARSDEVDRVVGLEIGGDDYMVKPFSPRELSARIRAILRRSESQTIQTLQTTNPLDPFQVDDEKKNIRYYDILLDLSKQEFKILTVLLSHPGRVYSRSELMNAAWDEPGYSCDRTVDSHIKMIRSKLRCANSQSADPIETHRGFGYSLRLSSCTAVS
ncbi:MAG: two-component system response regulator CreB [Chitinispirillaceae bacterium]